VYRADETDLQRTVAVKLLTGEFDDDAKRRFDRERKAMGALSGHPNIVTVYRAGLTEDDRPYLVMEHMSGGSMAEKLAREGAIPWQRAVEIGIDLSGALEVAHQGGVLHRDIKPGNLLISSRGTVHLADFGIARLAGAPETRSAVITASLAHAAPEVIAGRKPDERADIYSLVSTLYELILGRPPFVSESDESLVPMLARIAQDPVPSLGHLGVPPGVDAVLARGMAKDPADRHQSASELAAELERAVGRGQSAAVTSVIPVPDGAVTSESDTKTTDTVAIATAPAAPESPKLPAPPEFPEPSEPSEPSEGSEPSQPVTPLGLLAPPPTADSGNKKPVRLIAIGAAAALLMGIGGFALSTSGGSDEGSDNTVAASETTIPPSTVPAPTTPPPPPPTTTPTTIAPTTTTTQAPTTTTTIAAPTTTAQPLGPGTGLGALVPGTGGGGGVQAGPDYSSYDTVTDGVGGVTVEVPTEWSDRQVQPGIILASTDVGGALSSYDFSGVAIVAARAGFQVDHDIGLDDSPELGCSLSERIDYDDGLYTGRADIWAGCGADGTSQVMRISASPADNSVWVIVSVQVVEPRDFAALGRIIQTFTVNGQNLP
jgi:serine/threonine protein kinase